MYSMRKESYLLDGLYALVEYVNLPKDTTFIELGSYRGESTEVWAKHYNDVIAIDPWDYNPTPELLYCIQNCLNSSSKEGLDWENLGTIFTDVEKSFDERMSPYIITKLRMFSDNALGIFDDGSIDIVYIDALHDYDTIFKDIEQWSKKVKPSGFISGHDYTKKWPGVIQAVDEHFGKPDRVFGDTSWVVGW
jgi:hypothetical protein